ncbi:hypothetical protein SBV1_40014 [Verrucomicrobia bacterium]|nr:hypothetical protein SBV1_40014 [Verrucomicrobiota bacterium]
MCPSFACHEIAFRDIRAIRKISTNFDEFDLAFGKISKNFDRRLGKFGFFSNNFEQFRKFWQIHLFFQNIYAPAEPLAENAACHPCPAAPSSKP